MKKVLVVFHIYYPDQIDWFLPHLRNISGCEWDLVVTGLVDDPAVVVKMTAFCPSVRFVACENVGYDVWPFIKVLKTVDLDAYDYILKIHTKNRVEGKFPFNGLKFRDYTWRDYQVNALLGSPEKFSKALRLLDGGAGMVFSYETLCICRGYTVEEGEMLADECARIGLGTLYGPYCAGTMFMCRTETMKVFASADISAGMFDAVSATRSGGTLAHTYERMLGTAVKDAGYKVRTLPGSLGSSLKVFFHKTLGVVLKNILTIDNIYIKGKVLIILGIQIPISKRK